MLTAFIHTGDFHLGRSFAFKQQGSYFGKNKRKELWLAFESIIETANQEKIPLILIAGDLFDSSDVLSMDVKRVADAFASLEETRVVIITGDHDFYGEKTPYKKVVWPPNVYIFKSDTFQSVYIKEINTEIFGISWLKNKYYLFQEKAFQKIKLNETRYNILMLHGDTGGREYLPLDVKLLEEKGFNAIALGHIHKPGRTPNGTAYCGSPLPLTFGETEEHGYLLSEVEVDFEKHQFITTSHFKLLPCRKYITKNILITPETSYQDIVKKVLNCHPEEERLKHHYRIRFIGYIDPEINLQWIYEDIEDGFYYVETDASQLELDIDIQKLIEDNKNNQIGQLLMDLEAIEDLEVRRKAIFYSIEAMSGEGVLE